ncbi:MAG: radical SAM protein [Pseudonocardiales bacterium]|nr:radical SAM protein [Pseudonocardiales bacterium]
MSLTSSYYNHYTPTSDPARTVLFNKFWGSVAIVDEETARALVSGHVAGLAPGRLTELERAGFFVPVDFDERAAAERRYLERKQSNALLAITVELTQECNLACPFCYQNSYRGTGAITDQAINRIQQYVQTVVSEGRRPITDVALRFIGGEPLMQKDKILAAVSGMRGLADRLGVGLNTQVDTNGLLLDEAIVRVMDATSITLTNKADHDTVRVRHNGAGSYDQVLGRIMRYAEHYNAYETVLAVRYNVNAFNAKYVPEVYRMVKGLGIKYTQFDLFNTVNYDYNALIPTLSSEQFKWLYLEVIKLKIEHGETVTDFPRPTFSPCSAYTPYNLKVTADGRLALCDAMTSPRGSTDDLLRDVGRLREIFSDIDGHNPFHDPQCGNCTNVGICGGKLYCKPDPCDFLPFDLDEFLRFFAETYPSVPNRFDLGSPVG